MADNVTAPAIGEPFATDEIGGVHYPRTKLVHGANGSATDVSAADPMPVTDASAIAQLQALVAALGGTLTVSISGTPTVDLSVASLAALESITVGGTVDLGATSLAALESITIVDGGGSVSIDDGAGSITVDGTVALDATSLAALETINAAQSGSWTFTDAGNGVADFAADSGNSTKVAAIYSSAPTVRTNGQRGPLQQGTRGGLHVNILGADGVNGAAVNFPNQDGWSTASVVGLTTMSSLLIFNGGNFDRLKKPNATSTLPSSTGTTHATSAKASAGDLFGIDAYNTTASPIFIKVFNKASAPTVGTDVPVMTLTVPPNGPLNWRRTHGRYFGTGIAWCATTGAANGDTTAPASGALVGVNFDYQ